MFWVSFLSLPLFLCLFLTLLTSCLIRPTYQMRVTIQQSVLAPCEISKICFCGKRLLLFVTHFYQVLKQGLVVNQTFFIGPSCTNIVLHVELRMKGICLLE